MFARFARRMTLLYVAVASSATAFVLGAIAACAIYGYVLLLDETAAHIAVHAQKAGLRALEAGMLFAKAVADFERDDAHSGIAFVSADRGRRPLDTQFREAWRKRGGIDVFVSEILAVHPRFVDFDGGRLFVAIDPSSLVDALLLAALAIVLAGTAAGLAAWLAGRYIAAEALRPLVDVTHSLQRFAARDFTPEPIAIAGRSEFDAVAEAYNAAAVQVDAAFGEHERADERIRQFVADAGHELRTPLTIVLGFTEHVRRTVAPGDGRLAQAFDSIEAEGARMRSLIDNLVLLARLDSEERGFVEPFSLADLLEELVAARRAVCRDADIGIDSSGDVVVFASRDDVREALGNVLDNALKYGERSPVRIAVRRLDESRVGIVIADGGPGIAPTQREAIFERFYRGEGARRVDGSGLGLAIARRATERAGGRLGLLERPPGTGAAFAFELPAGPAAVLDGPKDLYATLQRSADPSGRTRVSW